MTPLKKALIATLIATGLSSGYCAEFGQFDDPDWVDESVQKILNYFESDSVLIVGELHGTKETPVLFRALAQELAEESTLAVGLEFPRQEQGRIDAFLRSDGGELPTANLQSGEFWQVEQDQSDGRRSRAIVNLLDELRALRAAGASIDVVALDDAEISAADRREQLAHRIVSLAKDPQYNEVLVLMGNYHARLAPPDLLVANGKPLEEPPVPTAALIEQVSVFSVNVLACSGGFWGCVDGESCGPVKLKTRCSFTEFPLVEEQEPEQDGFHLSITLESLTPSPPTTE